MIRWKRRTALIPVTLTIAFALSACGRNESPNEVISSAGPAVIQVGPNGVQVTVDGKKVMELKKGKNGITSSAGPLETQVGPDGVQITEHGKPLFDFRAPEKNNR